MTDQPKENSGMSKDIANEAVTLQDLYERVQRVCMGALVPRIRQDWNPHGAKRVKSWRSTNDFRLDDAEAESIILAACVRWLADNGHQPICIEKNNSNRTPSHYPQYLPKHFVVEIMDTPIYQQTFSDNLAIAALLAVEAVCKERGNV